MYPTLVDVETLVRALGRPDWRIVDCRFDLGDPEAGRRTYEEAHIPGAVYADLERDLSGPPVTDRGRHPLPTPETLCQRFGELGIGEGTQVVAYDHAEGAFAARLWWLLHYMGHETAAVLNGGWRAWCRAGLPSAAGPEQAPPARFKGEARRGWVVRAEEVASAPCLLDARDPARYRGDVEPLDPVAGHIPGAVNHFFRDNVDEEGRFLDPATLRARLLARLGETQPAQAVSYCGSGVTACHNLLAMRHAGLAPGRLYAGSWSEWCRDPARPVATGSAP